MVINPPDLPGLRGERKPNMENKAKIVEENGAYRYFDRDGKELHDGDTIVYESGREEKLYLTTVGTLGTDATNPHWISTGRAIPREYGIYPLELSDLREARLKPAQ